MLCRFSNTSRGTTAYDLRVPAARWRPEALAPDLLPVGPVITPATALLLMLAADLSPQPAPPTRTTRPLAIWLEPELMFHSLGSGRADVFGSDMSPLPLGVELGLQLGPNYLLSAALARFPAPNIAVTQVTVGGRRYLGGGGLVPYLATEVGILKAEEDDTGGQTHTNFFAAFGGGVELMLPAGFTCLSDLQIGPENGGRVGTSERVWHLSAWYRLGVGYRF